MITKEQVNEMITKHFGNVKNQDEFLNELFENNNVLLKSRMEDGCGNLVTDLSTAFDLSLTVNDLMGESFFVSLKNSNNDVDYNGVSFYYYNKIDSDNNLIFHCRSKGLDSVFQIDSFNKSLSYDYDLSISKINELITTENSLKSLSKYFK